MAIRRNYLLNGLLKYNYFSMQKEQKEELPPFFQTSSLTPKIAQIIQQLPLSPDRKKITGFDCVKYYSTRYNNVPRLLSIPHPKAYCDLCINIYSNWNQIKHICDNTKSIIIPKKHKDGRVIIMDYENSSHKHERHYELAFGRKFIVKTDISNFYPSLYSHAISWALIGKKIAKKNRRNSLWYNELDTRIRWCKRNETNGVPIGPATSNIASEIILERIDKELKDWKYIRFIDDYTAYCKTHSEAEEFIKTLSRNLIEYGLNLNINKTSISELPQPIEQAWVNDIRKVIPSEGDIKKTQVIHILDSALILQKDNPDGSILKYAAKSIVNRLTDAAKKEFVKYLLELCMYYPILIPILKEPLKEVFASAPVVYRRKLLVLLEMSIEYRRSDSVAWLLYLLKQNKRKIPTRIVDKVVEFGDCVSLTVLLKFPSCKSKIVNFANNLDKTDLFELDNYWLLLYQLYYQKLILNPFKNDSTFFQLRRNRVSFFR